MGNFFEETMQGLLEAAEIAKGNIPLTEREDISSAPTFALQIMAQRKQYGL